MALPVGLGDIAPEADLRSVVIQRRDRHAEAEEAKAALALGDVAEGLFFSKGRATAHAFRRTYWSHGAPPAVEENATRAALDDETEGFPDDSASADAPAARTEKPSWSGPPMRRAPYNAFREDAELTGLERAFVAVHLPVLVQEGEPEPDGDTTTPSETPAFAAENPEMRAPEADLRTVVLFRSRREEPPSDELFVRKNHAATDATSSSWSHDPKAIPTALAHTLIEAREAEAAKAEAIAAVRSPDPAPPAPTPVNAVEPSAPVDDARSDYAEPTGNSRRPSLATTQVAIFAFGCIALLISVQSFILSSPSRPRDDVMAPPPQIVVAPPPPVVTLPQAPVVAVPQPPVVAVPPPVVALPPPPVVAVQQPPPAEVAQQPPIVAPVVRPSAAAVDELVARGDQCLRTGDVFAARLFYERAADAGNAHGALMVGATYDPAFLDSIGVHGLQGDVKAAAAWYGRAAALGDPDAAKLQKSVQHR